MLDLFFFRLVALVSWVAMGAGLGICFERRIGPGDSIAEVLAEPGLQKLELAPGDYFLAGEIELGPRHEGLEIVSEEGGAVLSGGVPLAGWQRVEGEKDLWSVENPVADVIVRQLFHREDGRMQRSRIPNEGWLRGDALSTVDFDVNREGTRDLVGDWRVNHPRIFAGLRHREEDDLGALKGREEGVMVQTLGAWEAAWQPLQSINLETRDLYFYTPARYPLAHWSYGLNEGGGTPFAIENSRVGLDLEGEWYFNQTTNRIVLMNGGKPGDGEFIVPRMETVLRIEGADRVTLRGLTFAHTTYRMGDYHLHENWAAMIKKAEPDFPESFPAGSSLPQSAPGVGAAVEIEKARHCQIERCIFRDTGGYGLHLGRGASKNRVTFSTFTRLGGGGVDIDPLTRRIKKDEYPMGNVIADCHITQGGEAHPAAVGIRIAEGKFNVIEHNEVAYFGYSGIHVGWNWNPLPNNSGGNIVRGNEVRHVMNVLCDGGGIYTLGPVEKMLIEKNYVHHVARAESSVASGSSGIFFDQYSSGTLTRKNVLREIHTWKSGSAREPHPIKHNKNDASQHRFEDNDVDAGDKQIRLRDVVENCGPRT